MLMLFGKEINLDEGLESLDLGDTRSVRSRGRTKRGENALSGSNDKAGNDKAGTGARWDKADEGAPVVMCDDFWEDFVIVSKMCLLRNPDADIYDVFETIRTRILGGWSLSPKASARLDALISEEESCRTRVA